MSRPAVEGRGGLQSLPYLPLGVAVVVTLAVAAALLLFTHPMGDDFCNGVNVRSLGVFGAVRNEYLHWGGRWSGHVLAVGFPALFELTRWYPVALGVIASLLAAAIWFLVTGILPLRRDRRLATWLTLTFLGVYWAGMPHPGQTVYWLEGAYIYSLNLSLGLGVIGCLVRLPEGRAIARFPATLGLALLALVVAAFHELFGLVLAALLLSGAFVAWLLRDSRGSAWLVTAVAALVGFASVVLAPGNETRQEYLPRGGSIELAVIATIRMWLRVADAPVIREDPIGSLQPLGWLADPKLLAATLLFATTPGVRALRPAWFSRAPLTWQVTVPLVWLAALSGSFLAGGYALGGTLPPRAFNALYLIFLLGWFLTVFVHSRWKSDSPASAPGVRLLRGASALLLALGLLVSTNFKYGLRDLAEGRAAAFDRAMTARYQEARRLQEKGASEWAVAPIVPWPSSYFRNDVGDISPPLRECVARYFGLAAVREAVASEAPAATAPIREP